MMKKLKIRDAGCKMRDPDADRDGRQTCSPGSFRGCVWAGVAARTERRALPWASGWRKCPGAAGWLDGRLRAPKFGRRGNAALPSLSAGAVRVFFPQPGANRKLDACHAGIWDRLRGFGMIWGIWLFSG